MKKIIFSLFILFFMPFTFAEKILTFAVVPQQSASKLAQLWGPIIEEISSKSAIKIKFATAPDIPAFEQRLSEGKYDIAYMNPYHYVVFNQSMGYQALAKARDKQIKGIMVVAKNSEFKQFSDLNKSTLAFPAPAAFAASILTQSDLRKNNISFTPKYVSSHDSVYRAVAKGIYPAGGGVLRTFNNVDPNIRAQLNILSTTKGYTPHAIAIHPNIKPEQAIKIQQALITMDQSESGRALLSSIKIKGFEHAHDADWDDIRALELSIKVHK